MKILFKSKKSGPGRLFTEKELLEAAKEKPVENLDDKIKEDKTFKLQDRMRIRGLDIAIENKKGSFRKGVDDDGEEWRVKMFYPYGYIQKTLGVDGDKVDCFVGPEKESDLVFIIHQNNPDTGKYDEDKVMLFFPNYESARDAYLAHYDSQEFLGDITTMDFEEFKKKVFATVKKPGIIKSFLFKAFGKQLKLFGSKQMELFTGEEKEGKTLLPSNKNPHVRRWQTKEQEKKQDMKPEKVSANAAKPEVSPKTNPDMNPDNKLQYKPGMILEEDGKKYKLNYKYQWEEVKSEQNEVSTEKPEDKTTPENTDIKPTENEKEKSKEKETEEDVEDQPGQTFSLNQEDISDAEKVLTEVNKITDFGEKIGGARKDLALMQGSNKRGAVKEKQPAWMKGFQLGKTSDGKYQPFYANEKGRIGWHDRNRYETKEEALMAIKIIYVAQKFRVDKFQNDYEIYRRISIRKREIIKKGFQTEEEGLKYLVEHIDDFINYKPQFPIRPHIEDLQRKGKEHRQGKVTTSQFKETFGFRGGEFGNWIPQDERQRLLDFAYDGLMDMSEILNLEPKALSLDGKLSIAFGSRGQGLSKAAAHYEPTRAVFNLTRIKGAGSVAHEWFHALDHYLGMIDRGKTLEISEGETAKNTKHRNDFLSNGYSVYSKLNNDVQTAFRNMIETLFKQPKIIEVSIKRYEEQVEYYKDKLDKEIEILRKYLEEPRLYGRRKNAATTEQLKRYDALVERIKNNLFGDEATIETKEHYWNRIPTREVFKEMNDLAIEVTGRSQYKKDYGIIRNIDHYVKSYEDSTEQLKKYQSNNKELRTTPTQFYYDSKDIDKMRVSDYWSTEHEMAARAFEAYIEDKIHEQNNLSEYLVHSTHNKFYEGFDKAPYPEGVERTRINQAFDKLFNAIEKVGFNELQAKK